MKQSLKLENIHAWPVAAKTLLIVFLCLFIAITAFYLDIGELRKDLQSQTETNTLLQKKLTVLSRQKNSHGHKNSINNALSTVSIKQLHALGFLQMGKKIWGILIDPSGAVHHVTVGTVIGSENEQVTQINAKEIVIGGIVLLIK